MESIQLSAVAPVRPAAPYQGGKRNLARRLVALIEDTPHRLYVEPFVGMGGVFLRRNKRPKAEVINDLSGDVANLFRILQRHSAPLVAELRRQVTSRAEFDRQRAQDPALLTDIERAARFLYLQRCAFGGKVVSRAFGVDATGPSPGAFDTTKLEPVLDALHARLAGVIVERLPWAELLPRYDRPHTLFYLDPPYYGCERDYGRDLFGRAEFEAMADALGVLRGRFILSLNDHPEVRRIFGRFEQQAVGTHYGINGTGMAPARELIITGRP